MRNHFIVKKGKINDLTELQKLFVTTITSICASDYNKQQIEVWASSVANKQRWDEMITKQFILIAQDTNKIVGFATLDNGNYLDFLYVHKDHQRQGIAQRLLHDIEAEARRLKQPVLTSDVSKTAKPFFEKKGYKTLEEKTNIIQGVEIINYKMIKKL
jgi:putative acetyltransferase